jgi:CHAT domain-containing protein/Tfp pilus assembly protein PilF
LRWIVGATVAPGLLIWITLSTALAQIDDLAALSQQVVQLHRAGKFLEAAEVAKVALAVAEKTLGPSDPYVGSALTDLADQYLGLHRYSEAEPLYKRALGIAESTLGPDNPDLSEALSNLAGLYVGQGRYAEAEPLYKRALVIDEKALGADDLDVAKVVNSLANLYVEQGRYAEAEPLYKRALAIREQASGPDHQLVAQSVNNLALFYEEQSRYSEAETLYKRALATWEKAFGPDHPDVALALSNLASFYRGQSRYAEAEPLFQRSLSIREKALGPDAPDVAESLRNVAMLYQEQGRYSEAEASYKRALAIEEKAFGPDDRAVAIAQGALADLYTEEARYAEAEALYKRVLASGEKVLGPDHIDIGRALNNLALLYTEEGRYDEAEPLYRRALQIHEQAFGPDNSAVATPLMNLAQNYANQGRYDEAEPLYERALATWEKALGPDHPKVATVLNNLAVLYNDQGRPREAESLYKRALEIDQRAHGPEHPAVATNLTNLAELYTEQGRYGDAEPLYKRALAIFEKALGPDHPRVAAVLNNLATLYDKQGHYADALPIVRHAIANKSAKRWPALPVLFGAQAAKQVAPDEAIDSSLSVLQRASQNAAGEALNALAARFSASNGRLAQLVRKDQDLAGEAEKLDKAIIAAVANEPSKRDAAGERRIRERIAAIATERDDLQNALTREFPSYAALSNPEPLKVSEIKALLADDEALVVVNLGSDKSYVWAITRSVAVWKEVEANSIEVALSVVDLRSTLDAHSLQSFDANRSFELYRQVLGPIDAVIASKPRLSFVLDEALTILPPQVLVTQDPGDKALRNVDWLVRSHAVTVLPSIASLKGLRAKSATAAANKPLIGFADPIFDRSQELTKNTRVAASITVARGGRGSTADIAELGRALPQLPETATELKKVAASVHGDPANLFVGADATETRVKQEKLDQFRIVYFATHGLLAGDVADFAKLNAEPALVLSLPEHPTELDDGLLTASEVAQLKLNAEWVVLSACNTASAEKPGAEALSGLARAFFYAGARSLVVSHWEVNSDSAVVLMTGTFAALAANPKLSHAEALQKSELAMIHNAQRPDWADPKYWAPFVVVGEPSKPAN